MAEPEDDNEIRWSRRAGAQALAEAIDKLAADQTDRRIAIWLQVRHGGRRMTEVAKLFGYRDGSGVHRVYKGWKHGQSKIGSSVGSYRR